MYGINKSFILSIALLVLSTGLSSLSLLRANKDTVVTVNKEQIVTQFAKELNSRSLSHERAQTLSKEMSINNFYIYLFIVIISLWESQRTILSYFAQSIMQ